jgi:hypothetical protein
MLVVEDTSWSKEVLNFLIVIEASVNINRGGEKP